MSVCISQDGLSTSNAQDFTISEGVLYGLAPLRTNDDVKSFLYRDSVEGMRAFV